MKITLLVDQQDHEFLQSEFGLSLLLETASRTWLFDCGSHSALIENMRKLDLAPEVHKNVILSHGHYDHTGGLRLLAPDKIWCTEDITAPHYSFHSASDIHNISMEPEAIEVLQKSNVHVVRKFELATPDFFLTGPIPRNSFEDPGGNFFHDQACTKADCVSEEQALLTLDGVLISGCCHAGIINTLQYCRQQAPEIHVHTIVGGLHLRSASTERLNKTADFLRAYGVKKLYLLHCTGNNAIEQLRQLLVECFICTPALGETFCC